MLYRLVRPMQRRTSQNRYFPVDVRSIAVDQSLRIPVGGSFVSKVISPRAVDIRFSLGTFDPAEVKQRQATAAAYLERVWQELRRARDNGPVRLLQDQVIALSGEAYRVFMRAFEREPGDVERWRAFRAEIDETMRPRVEPEDGEVQPDPERDAAMEARFCRMADELLDATALAISASTRKRLLESIAKAELQACDLEEIGGHARAHGAKTEYSDICHFRCSIALSFLQRQSVPIAGPVVGNARLSARRTQEVRPARRATRD